MPLASDDDASFGILGWRRAEIPRVSQSGIPLGTVLGWQYGPFGVFVDPSSPAGARWYNVTHVPTGARCGGLWVGRTAAQQLAYRLIRSSIPWNKVDSPDDLSPDAVMLCRTIEADLRESHRRTEAQRA